MRLTRAMVRGLEVVDQKCARRGPLRHEYIGQHTRKALMRRMLIDNDNGTLRLSLYGLMVLSGVEAGRRESP